MREFLSSAIGIVALVFAILGASFGATGVGLLLFVAPAQIGHSAAALGIGFLALGGGLGAIRMRAMRRRARLLETGVEVRGTIVTLRENTHVRVNRRHPWIVEYTYVAGGQVYRGRETMIEVPPGFTPGAEVEVRYHASAHEQSALDHGRPPGARGAPSRA